MPARSGGPAPVTVFLERLEEHPTLDAWAARAARPVDSLLGDGPVSDALRGRGLGHALHPLLVQVPLGALVSASLLDLVHGRRAAGQSRLLMGVTCLAAVPAALTGWAEWAKADDRTRRVGIAHAALNAAGVVTSVGSYLLRRKGWTPAAAVLTGIAGMGFGAGGLLGGHLSLVRKFASHDRPTDLEGASRGRYGD